MVAPDVDQSLIPTHVIDAVWDRLADGVLWEIVNQNPLWCALRPPLLTRILEIADELLLLRVDRDDWLAPLKKFICGRIDVLELSIAIWMGSTLAALPR